MVGQATMKTNLNMHWKCKHRIFVKHQWGIKTNYTDNKNTTQTVFFFLFFHGGKSFFYVTGGAGSNKTVLDPTSEVPEDAQRAQMKPWMEAYLIKIPVSLHLWFPFKACEHSLAVCVFNYSTFLSTHSTFVLTSLFIGSVWMNIVSV